MTNDLHTTLAPYVESKDVRMVVDEQTGYSLYNYTEQAQYSGLVKKDAFLQTVRGLILDEHGSVVARGFNKFFNHGEQPDVDAAYDNVRPQWILEKADGSLGIPFMTKCRKVRWATRGSFASEQAVKAGELADLYGITKMYLDFKTGVDSANKYTPLFEIIYPGNRVVVDYGPIAKLVFLGVVNNGTGKVVTDATHFAFVWWTERAPRTVLEYSELSSYSPVGMKAQNWDNHEGFVLVYADGHMVKVKFDKYLALHKVLTGLTDKAILEHVLTGTSDALLAVLPDELHTEVKYKVGVYRARREALYLETQALYANNKHLMRRELAQVVAGSRLAPAVFALADGNQSKYIRAIHNLMEP